MFDGIYSFASVALSLFAVWALRTSRRGADERYPWGREVWEPIAIVVKAFALAGLCGYALIGAIDELRSGGREIDAASAVAYSVVATVAGVAISVYLRRRARSGGSDLVRAEAAEWWGTRCSASGCSSGSSSPSPCRPRDVTISPATSTPPWSP